MSGKSDGCTFWPDGNYRSCCDEHDKDYEIGGSWLDRLKKDWKLAKCVKKAKHPIIAPVMFLGVRIFGSFFWRWHLKWNKK